MTMSWNTEVCISRKMTMLNAALPLALAFTCDSAGAAARGLGG
eukprot:CAMPEP_0177561606 /NCGR_PEP_ID=MMETSP0369-20130122/72030_1 /TAXON_ID=447022 ORGANISM="Scrippsiella hangoei-like, Strain SHHI-4" /NCGR_SAMPLE_ID=MMETSP0369 /ASSEMBLY_ACC=CAM_ASM_000364 /LENGTH=42 /DNA_ID= /DNA_START= /DNA_END= /DNA_ORIENTATION=